ncbi:hypothetical protein [Nitrosopumilus cobalaminigenes]|uniref:hypothetical protein n=1 Tax=Nitrosopumilus cobalaminigenes TaxID=1470066 RepID=UPI0015CA7752|nr:hypothetical protein [Nitrosopumilus cobalaminigenes]
MPEITEPMRKFMQSVGDKTWKELVKEAKDRDISIQELIRVEIIPMWLKSRE